MAVGPDASYGGQDKIYKKQMPEGVNFNGAAVTSEMVLDAGSLLSHYGAESYNGTVEPADATFAIAPGGANQAVITIQITDGAGNPISNQPVDVDVYLSDSTFGLGITATAPSVSAGVTAGTVLQTYTANKAFYAQCNAAGQIVLQITDAAHTGYYISVVGLPTANVSRQLVAGDY